MTKDELKKKLKSAWAMQQQLQSDLMRLQNLRDIANNVTPVYGPSPGGSGNGQKIENAVTRIIALEAEIRRDMDDLVIAIGEVQQIISLANDKNMEIVLRKRYLNYQKWEQIAAELGYAWAQVHRLHTKALNAILNRINITESVAIDAKIKEWD